MERTYEMKESSSTDKAYPSGHRNTYHNRAGYDAHPHPGYRAGFRTGYDSYDRPAYYNEHNYYFDH